MAKQGTQLICYTDDTILIFNNNRISNLKKIIINQLNTLNKLKHSGLKINNSKTKIISNKIGNKLLPPPKLTLSINNNEIKTVKTIKYLGIYIDQEMK